MLHLKKVVLCLVFAVCMIGCVSSQKASAPEKAVVNEPPSILGTWKGVRADGLQVSYRFNPDGSMVWTIGERPPIKAKYHYNAAVSPAAVDIFGFQVAKLQSFRYIGIAEVMGDSLRFAGTPTKNGLTIKGEAAVRPKAFPSDVLWLERATH